MCLSQVSNSKLGTPHLFEQNLALAFYEASKKPPNRRIPAKHRQDLGVSTMVTPAVTVAVVVTAAVVAAADAVAAAVDVVVTWIACSSWFLHVQSSDSSCKMGVPKTGFVNRIIDNPLLIMAVIFFTWVPHSTGGERTSPMRLYLGYVSDYNLTPLTGVK